VIPSRSPKPARASNDLVEDEHESAQPHAGRGF
jgi:hypothetical protein